MASRGFTLIELMIGLALGLLSTLVISQVLLNAEGHKRATTGGNDAQVSGALALYVMQRDIQMAGYGLLSGLEKALGCPLRAKYSGSDVVTPNTPLVPVFITFGASDAQSDAITVMSSAKSGYSVPMKLTEAHGQAGTSFVVQSTLGTAVGDLLVAVPELWVANTNGCTLFQATALTDTSVSHDAGNAWNMSLSSDMPSAGYASGSALINLGSSGGDVPIRRQYQMDAGGKPTLRTSDLTATGVQTSRDAFTDIVLVKALYGRASGTNGSITEYSRTEPTDNQGWRLVQAIRLVIVARASAYDRDAVTKDSPLWDVGPQANVAGTESCHGGSKCLRLDLSGSTPDSTDWQHYRYKVFDTVIPLRNVVWNQ